MFRVTPPPSVRGRGYEELQPLTWTLEEPMVAYLLPACDFFGKGSVAIHARSPAAPELPSDRSVNDPSVVALPVTPGASCSASYRTH